ncbi:MAG TPA: Crp/Fnr family transcriptional regulator [Armatimonadota bacterium]|jgi:CRP-like cAMP-binding protein
MEISSVTLAESLSPEDLRGMLAEHPLVENMDPRHLQMMADIVQRAHFDAGHYLFREGEPAERFYLITKGSVMLEVYNADYGPISIQNLGSGDVMGWSGFIPPHHWRFDAKVCQPTDALVFDTQLLQRMCEVHTDFGYDFMKRVAGLVEQRLNATKEHLQDAYSRPR